MAPPWRLASRQPNGYHVPYILALDQGTTSSRAIVFDHDGAIARRRRRRSSSRSSRSRAGSSTTRRRSGRTQIGVASEALARAALTAARHRRPSASPTSARPPSSGTARPASPSTTPSSGRTAAPPDFCDELKRDGHDELDPRNDRPGDRRLLFRQQGALAARQRARRARRGPKRGELAFGTDRQLADLEAHRRRDAHHRRHAMPRARCSSTSTRWPGTTSC